MSVGMAIGGVPHVGVWLLERCGDPKFPYRLRIYRGERLEPVLSFLVRDRWPGANQHIFCLREQRATVPLEIGDEVERVPVVALQRFGKRLTVTLDRARQKRCDFQIVEKTYKDPEPGGPTTYEQIFWFTQTAMQQRRPRGVRLHSSLAPAAARVRGTLLGMFNRYIPLST